MEGGAKVHLEENCSPLALELVSKPSGTIQYMTGNVSTSKGLNIGHSSHYSSEKTVQAHDGEPASLSAFAEKNEKQAIPFTISLSSGIESNVAVPPEGTAALQRVSVKGAVSENVLSHNLSSTLEGCNTEPDVGIRPFSMEALPPPREIQDTRPLQQITSTVAHRGELPLHTSVASDVLQLATSAPTIPICNATSEAEHRPFFSDEGIAFRKDKAKKRPRKLLEDGQISDLNKSSEKQPVIRWKDVWVAQLIHIRGRMHSTFTSPQRQRVDLWQIVKHEMTNSCHGFDKDSEACRKKWIRVYKEYKDDRYLSNDEKTQKCRFYDLVDFYMGDRACSFRNMPIRLPEFPPLCQDAMHSAKDLVVPPLLPSNEVDIKPADGGVMAPQASSDTSLSKPTTGSVSKKSPPSKKSRVVEKPVSLEQPPSPPRAAVAPVVTATTSERPPMKSSVQTMLSELVNIGKEMLQTTRDFEKEKLAVLHSIKETLGKIAKKI